MTDQPRQHSQKALAIQPRSDSVSTAGDSKPPTIINGNPAVDTQPQSVAEQKAPSQILGRYQILGELGRGGMGAVYLADDTKLKRQVALKIPQFEASKAEQMRARFEREAQMAAQLSHPNICQVYDVAEIDGRLVMSMEYIPGKTMAAYTKPGKLLSDRQAVTQIRKVALAVEAAHQKGMIHRDLKPGNIMLCRPDPTRKTIEPKVMDFGLAKVLKPTPLNLRRAV
jgi:serine/threonine protein kinase